MIFSCKAARYNDYLVRATHEEMGKNSVAKWADKYIGIANRQRCQKFLSIIVATTVFPIFIGMDLIINAVRVPIEGTRACLVRSKASKALHEAEAKECIANVERCFLGLVSSVGGFVSPDLVTRHYVPKTINEALIEAGGKYHSAEGKEHQPKTKAEVQTLVRQAIKEKKKVTISGAHFSQSKDTLPTQNDNICINMRKMNKVKINHQKMTATVQAGATWNDIQGAADKYGFGVKVMQASNVFSLGGSLSVNCHGWDHKSGSVSNTVRSITIIDAKGNYRVLTPKDELFGLIIGGHGFFGVIVEAEIDLTENETLVSWGEKVEIKDYVEYFKNKILPTDNHRMHLYRLSIDPKNLLKEGISLTYSLKTDKNKMPGLGVTNNLTLEPECGTRKDRILMHMARKLDWVRSFYWKSEKSKIIQEEKLSRNETMRPPIYAAFNNSRADADWLQEYFVKGKELAPFLEKLSKTLTENKVPLINASVRFVKKETVSKMPYAPEEDHFAIVLFFDQSLAPKDIEKTKKWVKEIIDYLIAHDGTYYLPYQHFADKEQFAKCYDVQNIIKMKNKYDKQRLFDNGLYDDYVKPWEHPKLDNQKLK